MNPTVTRTLLRCTAVTLRVTLWVHLKRVPQMVDVRWRMPGEACLQSSSELKVILIC